VFIISGYNNSKSVLILNDLFPFIVSPLKRVINTNPLYYINIKKNILIDIWNETCEYFSETKNPNLNTIYAVEKIGDSKINCYVELLNDFLSSYRLEQDRLIEIIKNFETIYDRFDALISGLRRDLYGSLNAFFRCLEKIALQKNGKDKMLCEIKERYMSKRNIILSSLLAQKIRGKKIDKGHYIDDILINNDDLLKYLTNLANDIKEKVDIFKKSINYASNGVIVGDSEYKEPYKDIIYKASNVTNGRSYNPFTDMWRSDSMNETHWLKIDLLEPKLINRLKIIHSGLQGYITLNYEIHGSNDNLNWDVLVNIENNDKSITVHDIKPCKYRFVKLYITKPCKIDFHARIYEFEILYCYNTTLGVPMVSVKVCPEEAIAKK
jgi:hypothetical protein